MSSVLEVQFVSKPMPIFSTIFEDHVEFNQYMKQVILDHRQNNPESNNSNVKAWHSSWDTHEHNLKFQPLVDRTIFTCDYISQDFFHSNPDLTSYTVVDLWAIMYEDSEYTDRHSHFGSDFSACYYVDVELDSSPIIFESIRNDGVNDNNQPLTIQPQNGMLLIWQSTLQHEVPSTKGKRISISMNIDKRGRRS